MCNCMKKFDKNEKTNAEHVQFLNQLNLNETRYVYLNPKGKIYCARCRGHGALALHIEFERFIPQYVQIDGGLFYIIKTK